MVAQIVVRDEGGDILTRDSLLQSLRLQQDLRGNTSIDATLQNKTSVIGIENVVANVAYAEDVRAERANRSDSTDGSSADAGFRATNANNTSAMGQAIQPSTPTLDQQISALESRSDTQVEALLGRILDPEATVPGRDATEFLPSGYEPGTTQADARSTLVLQKNPDTTATTEGAVYDAQVAIDSRVQERFADAFVFGPGIIDAETSQAIGDTFTIITPVALVLLLVVLTIAYRDLVDVLVSLFGVGVVLVWYAPCLRRTLARSEPCPPLKVSIPVEKHLLLYTL